MLPSLVALMTSETGLPELLNRIKGRGYWRVIIRPLPYEADRLSRSSLGTLLRRCKVSLRGWDYPHISRHTDIERHDGFIQQASEWAHYLEFWRFYRSGQFVFVGGIDDDWRDQSHVWPGTYDPANRELSFISTIYQFTEIFEFAARLAVTELASPEMEISVALRGLDHRTVYNDDPRATGYLHSVPIGANSWERSWTGPTHDLVGQRSALALDLLVDLWDLFDLEVSRETIAYHQKRLIDGTP